MNHALCAARLSFNARAVLVAHVDSLSSINARLTDRHQALALHHLVRIGLVRNCNRDDGGRYCDPKEVMRARTILTMDGREVLSELLALYAERYSISTDDGMADGAALDKAARSAFAPNQPEIALNGP